jgi:hypothetical protein
MAKVEKVTSNIDGSSQGFFEVENGLRTRMLDVAPSDLPEEGVVQWYLKDGSLFYQDEFGTEFEITSTGGTSGDRNIDGGNPESVYLPSQHFDGGEP